jgi:hypothetical protein
MRKLLGRIGEYGWVHVISVGADHSASFVSAEIHYKDPGGNITSKTTDTNDASAGTYGWTVTSGFFDERGSWEAMLELNLGASGVRKLKNPVTFWIGDAGE